MIVADLIMLTSYYLLATIAQVSLMKILNLSTLVVALLFADANIICGQEDDTLEKAKAELEELKEDAREELAPLKQKIEEAQKDYEIVKRKLDRKILQGKRKLNKAFDVAIESAEKIGDVELLKKLKAEKKGVWALSKEAEKKYETYARSLIKNYDKDGDGNLSKAEVKAMRRPPVGADLDGNGYITLAELADSLSGTRRVPTQQKAVPAKNSRPAPRKLDNKSDELRNACIRHAVKLFAHCDEDDDGRLSDKELEIMRNPPTDADSNGDGFVDKTELINSVIERAGVTLDNTVSGFLDANGHLVHELTLRDAQVGDQTKESGYLWTIKRNGSWTRQPFSQYGKLNEADQTGQLSEMQLSILAETLARCRVNDLPLRIDQYHGTNPRDFTLTFQKTWSALRIETNAPLPTVEENQSNLEPVDRFSMIANLMLSQMSKSN